MAVLVFALLLGATVLTLGMRRAPLWLWALALGALVFIWQSGLLHGDAGWPAPGFLGLLAWLPVFALGALAVPQVRRKALIEPGYGMVRNILPKVSETEAQALEAVLRHAGLEQAARHPADTTIA
jgi:acyl-CoA dehydrogenase